MSTVVTVFLGVTVFDRVEDLSADFFTDPLRCSYDFRGSEAVDDDKLR